MVSATITVVVPTRDRPESLLRCLTALERQNAGRALEVVVVDDGSRAASHVAAVVGRSTGARLVRGEGRGPAAARNLGVAAARAPVVLFTDDDCAPEPRWAELLAGAIEGGAAAAAGATVSAGRAGPLELASQQIADGLTESFADARGGTGFAASSNLGAGAELLAEFPFDESYSGAGGEDRDWCARLVASGGTIRLVPEAVVAHHQKLSLPSFWRKHEDYGRGARILRRRRRSSGPGPGRFQLRLIRRGFERGAGVGAAVCLAQAATAAGYARELVSERRLARG